MATRKRRLNIHNTDRAFNLHFIDEKSLNYVEVTDKTASKVRDSLNIDGDELLFVRDNTQYICYLDKITDLSIVKDLLSYGGYTVIKTDTVIPSEIIELLSTYRKTSRAVYTFRENFTLDEIENMHSCSMASKVVVDLPVTHSEVAVSVYNILTALHPLRYRVDSVDVSFNRATKSYLAQNPKEATHYEKQGNSYIVTAQSKYDITNSLRDALSSWKMNLHVIYNSEEDLRKLEELKQADAQIRMGVVV